MKASLALCLFFTAARATPVTIQPRQNEDLPLLKLPYGTWRATSYDADAEVYVFKNVRYAAAPTGDLRWAKPAPPLNETEVQDGTYGYSCYQSIPPSALSLAAVTGIPLIQKILGTGLAGQLVSLIPTNILSSSIDSVATLLMSSDLLTSAFLGIIGQLDVGSLSGSAPSGEDCLFLDLFVPRQAFAGGTSLPVVNYIYGGAYVTGTKEPIYDARPLVQQSGGNVIFVVGNYRLSALGFLGGSLFMQDGGTANAGFWDQRAVMQWIQDHISLVNGNPKDVSLWGESAGAGSVMHHLTAVGGTMKPLFKRAFVQSPWNVPKYDPTGNPDRQYDELVKALRCTGANRLACLRGVPAETLRKAVDKIVAAVPFGQFGFGATVDGIFAKQLPALELSEGNFAKDVESVIITHNSDEASMFVPELVVDRPSAFEDEIESLYGDSPEALAKIRARYDISKYANNREQLIDYMGSSYFLCNVRNIAKAYAGKAWLGQYSRGTGKHGTDIRVLFFNATDGAPKDDPGLLQFAPKFQSYFLSHAATGDVNTNRAEGTVKWPLAEIGSTFNGVMNANETFSLVQDDLLSNDVCDFWLDIWRTAKSEM